MHNHTYKLIKSDLEMLASLPKFSSLYTKLCYFEANKDVTPNELEIQGIKCYGMKAAEAIHGNRGSEQTYYYQRKEYAGMISDMLYIICCHQISHSIRNKLAYLLKLLQA